MVRLSLLALLVGCYTEPAQPVPTFGDAIKEVAYAQCSRWIECGTETEQSWQECVDDLVWEACNRLLDLGRPSCLKPYGGDFEQVQRCSEWFASVACTTYIEPCSI